MRNIREKSNEHANNKLNSSGTNHECRTNCHAWKPYLRAMPGSGIGAAPFGFIIVSYPFLQPLQEQKQKRLKIMNNRSFFIIIKSLCWNIFIKIKIFLLSNVTNTIFFYKLLIWWVIIITSISCKNIVK